MLKTAIGILCAIVILVVYQNCGTGFEANKSSGFSFSSLEELELRISLYSDPASNELIRREEYLLPTGEVAASTEISADSILIEPAAGVDFMALDAVITPMGLTFVESLPEHNLFKYSFVAEDASRIEEVIETLSGLDASVANVVLDYKLLFDDFSNGDLGVPGIQKLTNDQFQYDGRTIDFNTNPGTWWARSINLFEAWDLQTDCSDTIVGVIDSGATFGHEDLTDLIVPLAGETEAENVDTKGHGTFISGLIGARGDNGVGVSGVCQNSSMIMKKPKSAFTIAGNIRSLVDAGAEVINMSMTIIPSKLEGAQRLFVNGLSVPFIIRQFRSAFEYARDQGVIVVLAAGNNGLDNGALDIYPQSLTPEYSNVISVSGSQEDGSKNPNSNFGIGHVDIAAPSKNMLGTYKDLLDYMPANAAYKMLKNAGTSSASPQVAGAIALYLSYLKAQNEPSPLHTEVIDRLLKSARREPTFFGRTKSGGVLDVRAFILGLDNSAGSGGGPPVGDLTMATITVDGISKTINVSRLLPALCYAVGNLYGNEFTGTMPEYKHHLLVSNTLLPQAGLTQAFNIVAAGNDFVQTRFLQHPPGEFATNPLASTVYKLIDNNRQFLEGFVLVPPPVDALPSSCSISYGGVNSANQTRSVNASCSNIVQRQTLQDEVTDNIVTVQFSYSCLNP